MQKKTYKNKRVNVKKRKPGQPKCSSCGAKIRMNYPFGRKSKAFAYAMHLPSCTFTNKK